MKPSPRREYQVDFSHRYPDVASDRASRLRKARTMVAVLADFLGGVDALRRLQVLDVGASSGVMDTFLAGYCGRVVGIDIDREAIRAAQAEVRLPNLEFREGDAMALDQATGSVDLVVCAHVYEHVPDPERLLSEISRVLRPGGVCYFAAGNRYQLMEPHYRLPLLSVVPVRLADGYLRLLGRGQRYYERHLSYWGLQRLTRTFIVHDYTRRLIDEPLRFETGYMLPPGGWKQAAARSLARFAYPWIPTYIWLLEKRA